MCQNRLVMTYCAWSLEMTNGDMERFSQWVCQWSLPSCYIEMRPISPLKFHIFLWKFFDASLNIVQISILCQTFFFFFNIHRLSISLGNNILMCAWLLWKGTIGVWNYLLIQRCVYIWPCIQTVEYFFDSWSPYIFPF